MMRSRLVSIGIAVFLVLWVLHEANGASINKRSFGVAEENSLHSVVASAHRREAREDHADEDSDEDAELEAEQVQQQILRNQEAQEQSEEDSEEDDDSDDRRRRRRDVTAEETAAAVVETPVEPLKVIEDEKKEDDKKVNDKTESDNKEEDKKDDDKKVEEEATAVAAPPVPPVKKQPSVLILIRDALKKVTTELPTQQVATNALQYFQLFEHFLQQAIEQVIGDDDDEEDETTTIKAEVEAVTEDSENKKPVAEVLPVFTPSTEAVVEGVANVAQAMVEGIIYPAVVPEQVDVPKEEVGVPEAVASNKV